MQAYEMSSYRNAKATTGATVSLQTVLSGIRTSQKLIDRTAELRAMSKEDYDANKWKLPAVTFGGVFTERRRDALETHSGLLVLDVDHIAPEDFPGVLDTLATAPQSYMTFISPSGAGVKVVIRLSPVPRDATEHGYAFDAARAMYDELLSAFDGVEIDKSGRDVSRLCFLCHDPDVTVNVMPFPLAWEIPAAPAPRKPTAPAPVVTARGDSLLGALAAIPSDDYDLYLKVGQALHDAEGAGQVPDGYALWLGWASKSSKFDLANLDSKWRSFTAGRGLSLGTVYHLAETHGWTDGKVLCGVCGVRRHLEQYATCFECKSAPRVSSGCRCSACSCERVPKDGHAVCLNCYRGRHFQTNTFTPEPSQGPDAEGEAQAALDRFLNGIAWCVECGADVRGPQTGDIRCDSCRTALVEVS